MSHIFKQKIFEKKSLCSRRIFSFSFISKMLDKLPVDNITQILGYLKMRDLASVDRSSKRLWFVCAQLFLRNKKYQKRKGLLDSVLPHIKCGRRWSSPERVEALKRVSRRRNYRKTPFEFPENERVLKERRQKRKLAEKALGQLFLDEPENKQKHLRQLRSCRYGEEHEEMNSVVLQAWNLVLGAYDEDAEEPCLWVDDMLLWKDFEESSSDSD